LISNWTGIEKIKGTFLGKSLCTPQILVMTHKKKILLILRFLLTMLVKRMMAMMTMKMVVLKGEERRSQHF